MQRFYRHFLEIFPPAGLGDLIPAILGRMKGVPSSVESGQGSAISSHAWPAVERIITCLLEKDFLPLPQAAVPLVGLGEGLTPSGDDLLGGLFFALDLLALAYPGFLDGAQRSYSGFIPQCKFLTNEISFTLMQDHSRGHSLQPLHGFAQGMLEGRTTGDLLPLARELIIVGNSTGWDLLTGFLAGMWVTFPL